MNSDNSKKEVKSGDRTFVFSGDSVSGYTDRTGKPINGDVNKICGDPISGFRDSHGNPIDLIEKR